MPKHDNVLRDPISRRSLLAATGAALTAGLVTGPGCAGPQAQQSKSTQSTEGTTGGTTAASAYWCVDGLKNTTWGGKKGFRLQYENLRRALPLAWIRAIVLKVDGKEYDQKDILVVYQNRAYTFEQLGHLGDQSWREVPWWRLFDRVDVFVPSATPLSPGEHVIEGALVHDNYIPTIYQPAVKPSSVPPQRMILETD